MNAHTLKALKDSIAKWERNAVAERPDDVRLGSDVCPLCEAFHDKAIPCDGCPVRDRTGRAFCVDSPYIPAWTAWHIWNNSWNEQHRDTARAAASDEVSFLKSLLPDARATGEGK